MSAPERVVPGPGQESVWDYPRPPRVEPVLKPVEVRFGGEVIARTERTLRVLETSHPPVYYIPRADVVAGCLVDSPGTTWCEYKGAAAYFDVVAGGIRAERAAWTYPDPSPRYAALAGAVAFYPGRMDACFVGDERVSAQPGGFYGGWITSDIVGPFKGDPGTRSW